MLTTIQYAEAKKKTPIPAAPVPPERRLSPSGEQATPAEPVPPERRFSPSGEQAQAAAAPRGLRGLFTSNGVGSKPLQAAFRSLGARSVLFIRDAKTRHSKGDRHADRMVEHEVPSGRRIICRHLMI